MHVLAANKLGALGVVLSDRMDEALGGLSPSASAVLSMLHFKPELTTTSLAAICGVRQPTTVRLIDGLVRLGMIERRKVQGRATPLVVTELGHETTLALQRARLATLQDLLAPLDREEQRVFEAFVDRIIAGATTSRGSARTTCRLCEHDICEPGLCPVGNRADELDGDNTPSTS